MPPLSAGTGAMTYGSARAWDEEGIRRAGGGREEGVKRPDGLAGGSDIARHFYLFFFLGNIDPAAPSNYGESNPSARK